MAAPKAYIPSRALIRALSRPQPSRCPYARAVTTPFVRQKRTKAAKPEKLPNPDKIPYISPEKAEEMMSEFRRIAEEEDDEKPPTDEELESEGIPAISWYEQDLAKGGPRRLIKRVATAEDRKKEKQMYMMMSEAEKNPDSILESKELQRRLIDSLIENPNFADLAQELKEMKGGIRTKAEHEEEIVRLSKQEEQENEEMTTAMKSGLKAATQQMFQGLLNDPAAAAVKEEVQEVLDKLPEMEDIDNPEFQAIVQKAMAKLDDDPIYQKKVASMPNEDAEKLQKELDEIEREDEAINKLFGKDEANSPLGNPDSDADVNQLIYQMRDVLKSMGGDASVEAELDALLTEETTDEEPRPFDAEELTGELIKLVSAQRPKSKGIEPEDNVPADLQAKVDKIMEDPRLMEKLAYIQNLIEETERAKSDITSIAHEVAPDPYELEDTRTATLKQRMQAARQDPEHIGALDRLRVTLPPPFNISPALKSFNQAIEFAYIGANDDIRRILWRSYQKARTLPTFLPNVSDEAWDILYYSQAVTWGSNQNRQDHLRTLLADLKKLGRDGPPTHPSTLVRSGDGEHLEDTTDTKAQ
ncbi:hypothetical protein HBI56_043020 [Parastagonospora nodorum]|uniref:Uncharacterized protein n=1 Tax=Phaeosphaeria nodorum (strain SN15 / ATCC MYA-4574 / FGSC 10173) TaxID=321614 RepID=A0A7U2EUK6_PHANO|nr:hypothetical protein HBH56_240090 [Parastagonospora nodorum]QRC93137.1 hypothetical protein JI435_033740 [Parastagonospora nodorum SN15]KAH3932500.1 hypothetical protein HBH54_084350 [Parastagonospora nodorum]KAH3954652.1 hypothetical protein HBH53_010030 [Parastagonospora nodorum]KAH3986045.1 hypothetical protein HBH52_041220 [Parastagonospora nodorum]